jgi:hypothetical protein
LMKSEVKHLMNNNKKVIIKCWIGFQFKGRIRYGI